MPSRSPVQMAFARRVQELTPINSLIVVGGYINAPKGLRRREPDGIWLGSVASELYQSHRKGWYVHTNHLSYELLLNLREKGADYFVTLFPGELNDHPALRRQIEENFHELERTDGWEIYSLRGPR